MSNDNIIIRRAWPLHLLVRCACCARLGYINKEAMPQGVHHGFHFGFSHPIAMSAICGDCSVTRMERAALDEIRAIIHAAMADSDLSKVNLQRILALCKQEDDAEVEER